MSTTLSHSTNCVWCNCFMARGEKVWCLKTDKFNKHIHELVSRICGKKSVNAIGPTLHILSFLISPPTWRHQNYCTDCGHFDIKFSRSGRTIFAPMRLQDETYVSGSGHGGCDHYDTGYDRGSFRDTESEINVTNLKGFVVDDDAKSSSEEENSDSEEEWSDSSSEEEYSDSDREWD